MGYDFSYYITHKDDLQKSVNKDQFEELPVRISVLRNPYIDLDPYTLYQVYTRNELISKIADLVNELQFPEESDTRSDEQITEALAAYSVLLFNLSSYSDKYQAVVRYG